MLPQSTGLQPQGNQDALSSAMYDLRYRWVAIHVRYRDDNQDTPEYAQFSTCTGPEVCHARGCALSWWRSAVP